MAAARGTRKVETNGYGLRIQAWACVHTGDDPHIYQFANGFGVYPDKEDAEHLSQQHGGAYVVVPVVVAVGVLCGMEGCNIVHHPDWGKGTAPRPKKGKAHAY